MSSRCLCNASKKFLSSAVEDSEPRRIVEEYQVPQDAARAAVAGLLHLASENKEGWAKALEHWLSRRYSAELCSACNEPVSREPPCAEKASCVTKNEQIRHCMRKALASLEECSQALENKWRGHYATTREVVARDGESHLAQIKCYRDLGSTAVEPATSAFFARWRAAVKSEDGAGEEKGEEDILSATSQSHCASSPRRPAPPSSSRATSVSHRSSATPRNSRIASKKV